MENFDLDIWRSGLSTVVQGGQLGLHANGHHSLACAKEEQGSINQNDHAATLYYVALQLLKEIKELTERNC